MAARGTESKAYITQKILETFQNSFCYDKEIRVPVEENGEIIQIKIVLTAAKVNVECGGDVALPGTTSVSSSSTASTQAPSAPEVIPPTEEEKKQVEDLLKVLGL